HYGPTFAAKALQKRIPLWVLFLAVQLLDVFWSIFVILGIEKVRIVPGITATNPLDLYYMPYTHSLDGALLWAVAAGVVYSLVRRADGWGNGAIVGVAVFSHWILDLIVHRPDLRKRTLMWSCTSSPLSPSASTSANSIGSSS